MLRRTSRRDRELTARLYGGNQETRIEQEMVLGISGVRMLARLGITSRRLSCERRTRGLSPARADRDLVETGLTFEEASARVSATTVFTTHTPVPAGHDAFPFQLVEQHFAGYWRSSESTVSDFWRLAAIPTAMVVQASI